MERDAGRVTISNFYRTIDGGLQCRLVDQATDQHWTVTLFFSRAADGSLQCKVLDARTDERWKAGLSERLGLLRRAP